GGWTATTTRSTCWSDWPTGCCPCSPAERRIRHNRGMIVIQGSPVRRNLVLVLVLGGVLGFLLTQLFASLTGSTPGHWGWIVGTILATIAALWLGLRLAYPPLAYDP